jgi:hypothetical protein
MNNDLRSTSSKHGVAIIRVLMLVLVTALATVVVVSTNSHRHTTTVQTASTVPFDVPRFSLLAASASARYPPLAGRLLFPYSVVPGGVESPRELLNAMGNDPAVARHYAGFNGAGAHVVLLGKDLQAYVSYRIGQEIFWTKKPITLHKNETVITDGNLEARTRCGNRVSVTPQLPVSLHEPSPEALEAVEIPGILDILDAPMALPVNFGPLADLIPEDHILGATGAEAFVAPVIPLAGWGLNSPPVVPLGSVPSYPAVPLSPIPTPEPGTGLLLLLALSAGWLFGKTGKARRVVV